MKNLIPAFLFAACCVASLANPPGPYSNAPLVANLTWTYTQPFNYQINLIQGNGPNTFDVHLLPKGLQFNKATGLITAAPITQRRSMRPGFRLHKVEVSETNSGQTYRGIVDITILRPVPVITSAHTIYGIYNQPISTYQITTALPNANSFKLTGIVTGSPPQLTSNALPTGLVFDPVQGTISGIPTVYGDFGNLNLLATNSWGNSLPVPLEISIAPPPPVVVSAANVSGKVGQYFEYDVQTNPSDTLEWVGWETSAPGLAALNTQLVGYPTQAGSFQVVFIAYDSAGNQSPEFNGPGSMM